MRHLAQDCARDQPRDAPKAPDFAAETVASQPPIEVSVEHVRSERKCATFPRVREAWSGLLPKFSQVLDVTAPIRRLSLWSPNSNTWIWTQRPVRSCQRPTCDWKNVSFSYQLNANGLKVTLDTNT